VSTDRSRDCFTCHVFRSDALVAAQISDALLCVTTTTTTRSSTEDFTTKSDDLSVRSKQQGCMVEDNHVIAQSKSALRPNSLPNLITADARDHCNGQYNALSSLKPADCQVSSRVLRCRYVGATRVARHAAGKHASLAKAKVKIMPL